jgi:hypothetical protein
MSESVPEVETGETGEVDAGQGTVDTSAEDAEAEAQLHGIMQEQDPETLQAEVKRWQKLAQRHERAARTNSDAAAKLKDIEDAGKTELQKAADARQAAEERATAAESANARLMAAAAHDLPPDLIDYLGNGTSEEIGDRAEQLAAFINDAAKKLAEQMVAQGNGTRVVPGTRSRPVASMRPGAAPAGSTDNSNEAAFRNLFHGDMD